MMPRLDGYSVCRRVAPTLQAPYRSFFFTAKGHIEDRVKGLDVGADDYLVNLPALTNSWPRVRALASPGPKTGNAPRRLLEIGDVRIDFCQTTKSGAEKGRCISLPRNSRCFDCWPRPRANQSRANGFLDVVWGYTSFPTTPRSIIMSPAARTSSVISDRRSRRCMAWATGSCSPRERRRERRKWESGISKREAARDFCKTMTLRYADLPKFFA